MKTQAYFTKVIFFSTLQAVLLFASCSNLSEAVGAPVREYFEKNSTGVYIVDFMIHNATSKKDNSSNLCLGITGETESSSSATVRFTLSNPLNLALSTEDGSLKWNLKGQGAASRTGAEDVTLEQDPNDRGALLLTYPIGFLEASEKGGDISVHIEIFHPENKEKFCSYDFPLLCNTAPPQVKDLAFYKTQGETPSFVIAFTLPSQAELLGKHGDIKTLTVNGTQIPLTIDTSGTLSSTNSNFHAQDITASTPPTSYTTLNTGGPAYSSTGGTSCYYVTSDTVSSGNKSYTITLTDEAGLTSTVTLTAMPETSAEGIISIETPEGISIEATPTSIASEGGSLTLSIKKDGEDITSSCTNLQVYVYYLSLAYTGLTSNTASVTIPSYYPPGLYSLYVTYRYNDTTYSGMVFITKS